MLKQTTSALLILSLAACGGGGGGANNPTQDPDVDVTIPAPDGSSQYDILIRNVQQRGLDVDLDASVSLTALAARGDATYSGESFLFTGDFGDDEDNPVVTTDGQPTLAGVVTLTTTFGSNGSGVISGEITDFVDQNDVEKMGSLVIEDTSLIDTQAAGTTTIGFGEVGGTISGPGEGNGTFEGNVLISVFDNGLLQGGASVSGLGDPDAVSDDFVLTFNAEN